MACQPGINDMTGDPELNLSLSTLAIDQFYSQLKIKQILKELLYIPNPIECQVSSVCRVSVGWPSSDNLKKEKEKEKQWPLLRGSMAPKCRWCAFSM